MKIFKNIVRNTLYNAGYFELNRKIKKDRLIILMYHRFSEWTEPFKINRLVFENQLLYLKKKYNFISLNDYSSFINGERENSPALPIVLTIDDGYLDNYQIAFPVLKKYNVPATIFLATDFISQKSWLWSNKLEFILKNSSFNTFELKLGENIFTFQVDTFHGWHKTQLKIFNYCRHQPEEEKNKILENLAELLKVKVPEQTQADFVPLTWEQIKEMSRNKVNFGSHSCSHPILSRISNQQLAHEIIDSKKEIENKLDQEVISFAYPNGTPDDFNSTAIEILKKNAYTCAVTTLPGNNQLKCEDPFRLKRISTDMDDNKNLAITLAR